MKAQEELITTGLKYHRGKEGGGLCANVCACTWSDRVRHVWGLCLHSRPCVNQAISNILDGTRRLGKGRMLGRGGGARIISSD